jgi:hypothetical protein
MLPDALFKPLDLQHMIEEAERAYGARGVVDLLVGALTDRRVRRDSDIDIYLDTLKAACRQTRRYQEIIPVLKRIAVLNPARRPEVVAELALVHGHLKDPAKGIALLESTFAEQLRKPARRRSLQFCVVGEIAAAVLGRPALAREIATMGRRQAPGVVRDLAEPLFSLEDLLAPTAIVVDPIAERAYRTADLVAEHGMDWATEQARPRLSLVRAAAA